LSGTTSGDGAERNEIKKPKQSQVRGRGGAQKAAAAQLPVPTRHHDH